MVCSKNIGCVSSTPCRSNRSLPVCYNRLMWDYLAKGFWSLLAVISSVPLLWLAYKYGDCGPSLYVTANIPPYATIGTCTETQNDLLTRIFFYISLGLATYGSTHLLVRSGENDKRSFLAKAALVLVIASFWFSFEFQGFEVVLSPFGFQYLQPIFAVLGVILGIATGALTPHKALAVFTITASLLLTFWAWIAAVGL